MPDPPDDGDAAEQVKKIRQLKRQRSPSGSPSEQWSLTMEEERDEDEDYPIELAAEFLRRHCPEVFTPLSDTRTWTVSPEEHSGKQTSSSLPSPWSLGDQTGFVVSIDKRSRLAYCRPRCPAGWAN